MTNATAITSAEQLSGLVQANAGKLVKISASTKVTIEGCHIKFLGNTKSWTAKGARYDVVTDTVDGEPEIVLAKLVIS